MTNPAMDTAYRAAIEKAYIKPIRTVIAVDDEFPTLDAVIKATPIEIEPDSINKRYCWSGKPENVDRALRLLDQSRSKKWMFDIHDGSDIATAGEDIDLSHLHQTDMLILDYQLNGEQDNGQKSR